MVPMGLAEKDVSDFVEELMARHREAEEKLKHIDSLRELATRTLQDAQALAEEIKERGRKEADEYAQSIIPKAEEQAQAIVEAAKQQALILQEDAQKASDRVVLKNISLAQVKGGELIVGAQELAERLLAQVNASEGSMPGSAGLTSSRLEHWLAATSKDTGSHATGEHSSGATDDISNRTAQSGPVIPRRGYPRPTFRWKGVSGATRYALCIFGPPYGMDDIVFLRGDIIETSLTLPFHLEERVAYRWTVCGGSATGWGKPSPYLRCTG